MLLGAATNRPERLGAKPGNRIGLQLLHCEGEWAWCADRSDGKHKGAGAVHGEGMRLSNRIEIAVPRK